MTKTQTEVHPIVPPLQDWQDRARFERCCVARNADTVKAEVLDAAHVKVWIKVAP